ncbi:MAG: malate synthase A [Alphaproteobacteria bacterium]|nr:malate synthase A [Alphaproteobacteria bacterium]
MTTSSLSAAETAAADGLIVTAPQVPQQDEILTVEALSFLSGLEEKFGHRRRALMQERKAVQKQLDEGWRPTFPPETEDIRKGDWKVAPAPADLQDRRVEITGPVDRKMIINALNSGANCFMADFEDSNTPTWENQIAGQVNLRDANLGTIAFTDPSSGKSYALKENPAVLLVRPRGLHMEEKHVTSGGQAVSASFFDFGLYLFHNAAALDKKGSGPYYYLPKLESRQEAQLWEDVISHAEDALKLQRGTVRVTILIETITAAFQMDEILHALKNHIVGLNCGRWDYIFSFIKKFAKHPEFILPDRGSVGMTSPFLRAYSLHLIKTCHRRGAHAMGGMAAQIPIKNDAAANDAAMAKVRADKEREAKDGHDGTWVAHPGLVALAKDIFDAAMPKPNQLDNLRADVNVVPEDLLKVPAGDITEEGLRKNVNVGLLYLKSWLAGNGCVPIYNLMEDAATAEISRTQLWQWRRHKAKLSDGRALDDALMKTFLDEESAKLAAEGDDKYLQDAVRIFNDLVMSDDLADFLTTAAYDAVLGYEQEQA